jgi:hypothetical protein
MYMVWWWMERRSREISREFNLENAQKANIVIAESSVKIVFFRAT